MIRRRFWPDPRLVLAWWVISTVALADGPERSGRVDFDRDVRPILSDTCFPCHGPDKARRKADLRLDTREGAFLGVDGRHPFEAGKVDESEALLRISSDDLNERMPPRDARRQLSAAEIETLRRWVREGTEWKEHWSLLRPRRPVVPTIKEPSRARNPIDSFVLERLDREGMCPSPEADRTTLIRRATLDLTGLPPTLDEIDSFLKDTSPDAFEKIVDRLLASPRYGERMALAWLDAARYADTNGYQGDGTRTMWPWRDWVVRSLNENLPFDRFTVEQIAGDLLPEATQSQRLATGFHRNHMLNGEGGRVPEESRVDYVVDRVDTTSTVWLGLTIACARCHDHKFDPITQKEYYGLFAYFNNLPESGGVDRGGNAAPVMKVMTPESEARLAELRVAIEAAKARLDAALPEIDAEQAEWERSISDPSPSWIVADPISISSRAGATLTRLEDRSILAGGESPSTDVHEVVFRTDQAHLTGLRLEALSHESLPSLGPGRAPENGNFVLNELEVEIVSLDAPSQIQKIAFDGPQADFSQPGWDVSGVIDADPASGWAVMGAPSRDLTATFPFKTPVGFPGGTELRLRFHYESKHDQHTMGRFRLSTSSDPLLPPQVAQALAIPSDRRDETQRASIREHYRLHLSARYRKIEAELAADRQSQGDFEKSIPEVMVMEERPEPRPSAILIRGAWDKPGEPVQPGVPSRLITLPSDAPPNRLALARWLVDPAHPLTARVAVNRAWQTFFGVGLVKTSEDFGVQGTPPSHPELLNWLAVEFVEHDWDVKALHRSIITSATYRQSSKVTPEALERDPENRLLARGPRHRLASTILRDQALALGGLLVEKIGGPPVFPYQPPGIWEEMSFGKIRYQQDHGEGLYRRSLYTFWRRTVGPPDLFDVAARQVCTVRQPTTNTPLQSLILLNDVAYIEAARGLASRLLNQRGPTVEDRVELAFRMSTSRKPNKAEREVLIDGLRRQLDHYRADPEAALMLVSIGESPRDPGLDVPELAAYTVLASTILGLDETITKE
ncbi:PSD1 and planctomycete cytochrome C domain-containing protein [Tundrisphaera lichenicola]|uniref:PSD1 and planctomycete cytochrome C domain-containing protein n=1 Tax=Tundrisphaera lichenicola TaxID=2029860 RepID=UPI003EBC5FB7